MDENLADRDISDLFSPDLHLRENPRTIQEKLRSNGINTIGQLLQLTEPDLISIGLQDTDATTLLNHARNLFQANLTQQNNFQDISSWLRAHNLRHLEQKFANIPISMVPYIRRSDLASHLKIPLVDPESTLTRLWNAITSLPFKLPPPIHHVDDTRELICTASELPMTIELNETNFVEMLSQADKKQSTIKVSFLGDTGSGKSLTVMQLLSFDDRIRHGRGPLIAAPGQLESTTGNVCVYPTTSNDGKHRFLLLDFEGAFGGMPKRLREKIGQQWEQLANHHATQLQQLTKHREEVVKTLFPQLAYLISNIVVLIDKQPPHHTGYVEKLTKFAELSTKNSGTGEKPFLIVIQNFANPGQQKGTEAYNPENSTQDFYKCIQEQQKTQELLQHYREVRFFRLPSWNNDPILFDQQICSLQKCLNGYAEMLKKDSWFSKNFWNDYLWLNYVKALCNELKQSPKTVHIPRILVSLVQPQLSLLRRIMNFWRLIWIPPIVGEERDLKSLLDMWNSCYNIAFQRFSDLVFEELHAENLDHMLIKDSVLEAVKNFNSELEQHSPCLYQIGEKRVCGIAKRLHTTGHYGHRTGEHEGPKHQSDFLVKINEYIKQLITLSPESRTERNLELLQKGLLQRVPEERAALLRQWIPFCLVCLRNFEKGQSVRLLSCGHVVCEKCSHSIRQTPCPIHRNIISFVDFKKRIHGYAHPRVLSLDGGGLRGIILLRILDYIEKRTEYKIKELFDLVVGSGVGGLVAMLISLKNESVSNYLQLFLEYPQRIFKTNFLAKLGIWSKSKYKMKAIEEFVKELFGDTLTMTNVCKPENALVSVAAFRTTSTTRDSVFFTNYVHESGLSETEEFSGRKVIHNCYVWEVAAVCLTIPPLFPPLLVGEDEYISGSFVANNPSFHAMQEAAHIWKRPPDCLISIGTGFSQKTQRRDDAKLHWAKHFVDIPNETSAAEVKTQTASEKYRTFYARINPEFENCFKIDTLSKSDLQTLFTVVATYLNDQSDYLKKVCQRLVASLLYVSEIRSMDNDNSRVKIIIRCRQKTFRVSSFLGGPNWQLVCIPFVGQFTTNITYDPNRTQDPIAIITVQNITTTSAVGIDLVIGKESFPISGGGYINLSSPYSSSLRPLNPQTPSQNIQNGPVNTNNNAPNSSLF